MLCSICKLDDADCFWCPQCNDPVCMDCGARYATSKRKRGVQNIGCFGCLNVNNFRSTYLAHRNFVYSRDVNELYGSAETIDTEIHSFDVDAGWST